MKMNVFKKASVSLGLAILVISVILTGQAHPGKATGVEAGVGVSVPNGELILIRAGTTDQPRAYIPPPEGFLAAAPETATIHVTYVGTWDPNAQAAFQYAVDIWETLITSGVTIEVQASWADLGQFILGAAGTAAFFRDFSGAPVPQTWYPIALANKLHGSDLDPGPDIYAQFNSAFPAWYFGTGGNPGFSQYDFVSVVMHEIGHGLGFFGSMKVGGSCGSGLGCWGRGNPLYPDIYDLFTVDSNGDPLLNLGNFSPELADQLTSNHICFSGSNANGANGGVPARLYSPGSWQNGSSYSHLDENTFNGTAHALMTPVIYNGEANHNPGGITLGIFKDVGWTTVFQAPAQRASLGPSSGTYLPILIKNYPVVIAPLCPGP